MAHGGDIVMAHSNRDKEVPMRNILLALILCLAAVLPAAAQSTNGRSVAYYINYQTGAWGFGLGYNSSNQAEHAAFDGCGGHGCRVALLGTGRCIALFKNTTHNNYGAGRGQSLGEVERIAKGKCAGDCQKLHSACV